MKRIHWRTLLIATIITALSLTVWLTHISKVNHQAELQRQLQVQAQELDTKIKELEKTSKNASEAQKRLQELEKQKKALQDQLSAKRARNKVYAASAGISGTCTDWMQQAGVAITEAALTLIRKESGCNPYAVNSSSGACGIAQELPCGKSGCSLGDPVCQLRWMQQYVTGRYGSWSSALSFHYANNWY